ncbi:MAG TPA: hypothetical protein VGX76_02260 [Pirellulales bacterium]|jgi:hypothetical protein|nr:hypothetical protein [Pirellulales bacterium]
MSAPAISSTAAAAGHEGWLGFGLRALVTAGLVAGYYWVREPLGRFVVEAYARTFPSAAAGALDPATPRIVGVVLLLAALVAVWRRHVVGDPRFHAPLLVTTILAVGDAAFNILENHPAPPWLVAATGGVVMEYSPTFVAILATILAEIVLGRTATARR